LTNPSQHTTAYPFGYSTMRCGRSAWTTRNRHLQPTCQRRVLNFRPVARTGQRPTRTNIALHGALSTDTPPCPLAVTFRDVTS
jgi:hypothetical protein